MQPAIMKSHREALENWAREYEGSEQEGANEVAFLMQRASRQIGRVMGDTAVAPEPRLPDPPVDDVRPD